MKKDIIKLLNLKGVIPDKIETTDRFLIINIRYSRIKCMCPYCGFTTKRVHDKRIRYLNHGILNSRIIKLKIIIRRFKCSKCKRVFSEPNMEGIDRKKTTKQQRELIVNQSRNRSCKEVGIDNGLTGPTVMSYLHENMKEFVWPEGEIKLCIDEHSYKKRDMKITIAELVTGQLVTILPNRNKRTLVKWLNMLPYDVKQRISEVCIDMWQGYKNAVEETLPNTNIVIDKFHVIKEMLRHLDEIRRIIQELGAKGYRRINRYTLLKNKESLSDEDKEYLKLVFERFKSFDTLRYCYSIKERVRDIYKLEDKREAVRQYDVLLTAIEKETFGRLKGIHDTLLRWRTNILNYFNNRSTNALIEGMHCKIKTTKRVSYGFRNFENYEVKLFTAFYSKTELKAPHKIL